MNEQKPYLLALVLTFAALQRHDANAQCADASVLSCVENHAEVPVGLVDGTNSVFLLSEDPESSVAAHLFINGSEISQSCFRVEAKRVTFVASAVPHTGSSLWILYAIRRERAPMARAEMISTPDTETKALIHAILREQVLGESVPPTHPQVRLDDHSAKGGGGSSINLHGDPRSLSMLMRSVARPHERGAANGFEGTGDLEGSSPYDYLRNHAGSGITKASPRSIDMLRRQLSDSEEAEGADDRNHK